MSPRLRFLIPIVGSFAVYLVPLVGPHAVWLVGEALLKELSAGDREPWWLVADLALAMTTQAALGVMLAWSLRGSRLRLLTWLPTIPLLLAGLNVAYLVAIPSYFLIESDTAPEVTGWKEHCFVPAASLMPLRTPVNQPAAGVREWWVQRPDGSYALLRLPDCAVIDAGLPSPTVQPGGHVDSMLGLQFSAPGGAAVFERLVPRTSERTWWLLTAPGTPLTPIEPPDLAEGAPILSDSADAVAWIRRVEGSTPPVLERVTIRALAPSPGLDSVDILLAPFGPASYTLLGVDTAAREAILWRNDQPLVVGFDGERRDIPFAPVSIRPQASTYLRHRGGWVAWDAYRDEGPYWLSWSLAAGSGTSRANNGRSITSAAVDPEGRLIAMSETTTLSIGTARDVVYVIRTSDGADVFRVDLPRYARSQVVFFEGDLFGYSDLAGTHVMTIVP
ncbi:MAG TPA: hypothetical protein VM818_03130 [Vicinamibacterales bacterium]|nr:hypothetical protein [Vicinamibacterales bacterium]